MRAWDRECRDPDSVDGFKAGDHCIVYEQCADKRCVYQTCQKPLNLPICQYVRPFYDSTSGCPC